MSFWIHAFCNDRTADVTPDEFKAGIAKRLKSYYFFCPEEEEDPKVVLDRLRIETISSRQESGTFLLHYRHDATFIRVDRHDRAGVDELIQTLQAYQGRAGMDRIFTMLASVQEDVSFCLKTHDVKGMGFPLAIAGAAYLVEQKGASFSLAHIPG